MGVRAVGLMVLSTLKAGLLSGHWPLGHRYILLSLSLSPFLLPLLLLFFLPLFVRFTLLN